MRKGRYRSKTDRGKRLYQDAIEWIAANDEPGDLNPERVAEYISTALVADIFRTGVEAVALDIIHERKQIIERQ